jgi:DNA-directed RNA polymerase specialized sigma54-like protein
LNFDVEVSSSEANSLLDRPEIEIPDDAYTNLCLAWAKKKHDNWVKDRTEQGWRYGVTMSQKDMTHPLLRPWHDLPAAHRTVDTEQPQQLIDLLTDHGYVMISKEELEALKTAARQRK